MIVIGIIVGILFCLCLYFIFIHPKLTQKLTDNTELYKEKTQLLNLLKELEAQKDELNNEHTHLKTDIYNLQFQKAEIIQNIKDIQNNIEESNRRIYESGYALMQEKLDAAAEKERIHYENACEEYQHLYLSLIQDTSQGLTKTLQEYKDKLVSLKETISSYEKRIQDQVEYFKTEELKKTEADKYKMLLSETDIAEISKLKELIPLLRNGRPVAKAIWENYYRNACSDLIIRLNANNKTGIYKITNLLNQKSYIGQAVDIGERFKEHCKAGVGIDTPNSKLYKEMLSIGPENFSFEIIEECGRPDLNKNEAYWIKFFDTQTFGYNMTKGNK